MNENKYLVQATLIDYSIELSENTIEYLNTLPIDILAREVQNIIDQYILPKKFQEKLNQ